MSTKKYLSLEEAAQQLRIKPEELIRLREKGDVRGFADRGTWKFKGDDIDELARRRQPDSSPDLPMLSELSDTEEVDSRAVMRQGRGGSALADDDDEIGRQPTQIARNREQVSDSDVRLLSSDRNKPLTGTSGELPVVGSGSDSDIRLAGSYGSAVRPPLGDSDSDVRIVSPIGKGDSDSDVRLAGKPTPQSDPGSDSEIRLAGSLGSSVRPPLGAGDSDSDVRLAAKPGAARAPSDSDSDVRLARPSGSDSDVKLVDRSKQASGRQPMPSTSDSDVKLMPRSGQTAKSPMPDSSLLLGGTDATSALFDDEDFDLGGGSVLSGADSGISLEGGVDSGIALTSGDSGIRLEAPADSGILLEGPNTFELQLDDDDGLPGASGGYQLAGSGKKSPLADDNNIDMTAPMLVIGDDDDDLGSNTDPEVPMLFGEEDDLMPPSSKSSGRGRGPQTSVMMFDDDDETESMSSGAAKRPGARGSSAINAEPGVRSSRRAVENEESGYKLNTGGESSADNLVDIDFEPAQYEEEDEDEVIATFDDDLESEDSFETGSSQYELPTSPRAAALPEPEWSTGTFVLICSSLAFLLVGGVVGADLVRTVWASAGTAGYSGELLGLFGSLFK